jgi:hypothetical protein
MELPNDVKLCEQVFLAQPKPHRIKYAEKHRVVKNDMLKLQEFFEGCHDADMRSGVFAKVLEGKRRPRKTTRPRNLVAKLGTDSLTKSTIETDTTETDMVIGLMRGAIKMIASTIAIPHTKTARIAVAKETTSLVMTTEATPRLRKSRITRVATMPTMSRRTTRDTLVLTLALIALTLPSRRSKKFECHPPIEHSPTAPLQVAQKKTTTLTREKCPPMWVPRKQANGKGNPRLLLQRPLNAPALLFLPLWRATTMVGLGNFLWIISFLKRNLPLHRNQLSTLTQ